MAKNTSTKRFSTTSIITMALCVGIVLVFFYQHFSQQQSHVVNTINKRVLKTNRLNVGNNNDNNNFRKEDVASTKAPSKKKLKNVKKKARKKKQKPKRKRKKRSNKAVTLQWNLTGKFAHDRHAFTQGLEIEDSIMYETTGLYGGRSTLRKVDMETGKVLKQIPLGDDYFGEGMTIWGDNIIVITWKKRVGFVFDKKTFEKKSEFKFKTKNGQGWGLTHDEKQLIVSDGTQYIFFWDPKSFKEHRRVKVTWNGKEVYKVNELEYMKMDDGKGVILANIWYKDDVIVIDPENGKVIARYDMRKLLKNKDRYGGEDCLNGIAFDKRTGIAYFTGKLYQHVYKLKLDNFGKINNDL